MVRRLDEQISASQSFGWDGAKYEAALIDLQKAYPTANKEPFWYIVQHHGLNPHGLNPHGPFLNAVKGFDCCRHYK